MRGCQHSRWRMGYMRTVGMFWRSSTLNRGRISWIAHHAWATYYTHVAASISSILVTRIIGSKSPFRLWIL